MRLAHFITANAARIVSEWEQFARTCAPAGSTMDLDERRDHVAGMLRAIALDLETPQTRPEQVAKSKGVDDADIDSPTAANAHGTDRAATGYTPAQMVAEFRALRANVLRLWSDTSRDFDRASLDDVTRFNESIDQLLAESIARYAQDVDRAKDLVLGVLGHDLRNPLGAIVMTATVMLSKEGPTWAHQPAATRIITAGMRMGAMIVDLLDFTRSRLGGGIPIVRADMDLAAVCRATIDEIRAYHPTSVVTFAESGELRGRWDCSRIAQVLSNLIGNAYEHGRAHVPVEVVARGAHDEVVLAVHNEGPAIPKASMHDIFNPFRKLASTGSTPPTSVGLGLYIAQTIVQVHRGTIEVESGTRGTTFTVHLPRHVPD